MGEELVTRWWREAEREHRSTRSGVWSLMEGWGGRGEMEESHGREDGCDDGEVERKKNDEEECEGREESRDEESEELEEW